MKIVLVLLCLISSSYLKADKVDCDSVMVIDTIIKSKCSEVSKEKLITLYRYNGVVIKTTLDVLLNNAQTLGLTNNEIKRRAKWYKKLEIEKEIADFSFCNRARMLAIDLLRHGSCYVFYDMEIAIKEYRAISYRTSNCITCDKYFIGDVELVRCLVY